MTIKNLPQTNTKENKILAIEMLMNENKKHYDFAVEKEQFSLANQKHGYIAGLFEGLSYLTSKHFMSIQSSFDWAEWHYNESIKNKKWGDADMWSCCISGLNVCKSIIESGE